jgi:uncharacterized cupredoxin-like copper-binding protein
LKKALLALSIGVVASASAFLLACGGGGAKVTVTAELKEYSVTPSTTEVEAGKIKFVAKNVGTVTHELAVVQVDADGNKREVADVEGIEPGKTREFTADLKAGRYQLACLIAPGEAGSVVDHYQQGMHVDFIVK